MTGIIAALAGATSGGGTTLALSSRTVSQIDAAPSVASYSLGLDGAITYTNQFDTEYWITPQSGMSGYEVRANIIFGTLFSGTANTWQNLGSTRTWSISVSSGIRTTQIVLQIRAVGDTTVLASATITLEAEALV